MLSQLPFSTKRCTRECPPKASDPRTASSAVIFRLGQVRFEDLVADKPGQAKRVADFLATREGGAVDETARAKYEKRLQVLASAVRRGREGRGERGAMRQRARQQSRERGDREERSGREVRQEPRGERGEGREGRQEAPRKLVQPLILHVADARPVRSGSRRWSKAGRRWESTSRAQAA